MQKTCHNIHTNVIFLLFQDDAEGKEAVVDKLASVKAWLAELRKQQRQLDADKKELDADKELLEPEDARLFIRRVLVAQGL